MNRDINAAVHAIAYSQTCLSSLYPVKVSGFIVIIL